MAEYCGMEHGIAVCNGTVALELAIRCLDLAPGDKMVALVQHLMCSSDHTEWRKTPY